MALNVIYSDIESERRPVPVGNNVAPGKAILDGGRPAVTVTGSGDYAGNKVTIQRGSDPAIVIGGSRGGVSLNDNEATVTYTGTYGFNVTGASVATTHGTPVYITSGGTLTLTATGNTKFGVVEFFRGELSATDTAVTIGVNLG